ncbi:MAG: glycosyltransferase [Hyphomonadaceae bacterium]
MTRERVRPRVLISHQGCVPIYRKPLFERLARSESVDYVVAVGKPPRGTDYIIAAPPYEFETLQIDSAELPVGRKSIIWQPLVAQYAKSFDAIVLGEELKYASHLALAAVSKAQGKPLIWWGFGAPPAKVGATAYAAPSRHPVAEAVTAQLRKLGGGYLSYTESGRDALKAQGMPEDRIAVLNNTVDIDFQRQLRDAVARESDAELRAFFGLPFGVPVLLYFGRFLWDKQIDVLIRYVQSRRASDQPVAALIFGDGAEKEKLHALAAGAPDIVFRTHDDIALARALKLSIGIVIPGFVGLAITHGFAHGVPMITRAGVHPPEIEYLEHDVNGLLLPEDESGFFAGIDAFVASTDQQRRLSAGAEATAARLTMDAMAQRFDTLVQKLLRESGRMRAPSRIVKAYAE